MVVHLYPFVIGVDTHAKTHIHAVLAALGEYLGTEAFPNTHPGRARAIAWAVRRTGGDLAAHRGHHSNYGAQLARQAGLAGYRAVEAARMSRGERRDIDQVRPDRRTPLPCCPSHRSSCAPRGG